MGTPEWHGDETRPGGPTGRPVLRALAGGLEDGLASATDREMIERTSAALELFAAKWKVDLLYLLAAGVKRQSTSTSTSWSRRRPEPTR